MKKSSIFAVVCASFMMIACGEPGAQGEKGDTGDTGATGETGPKGDTGDRGSKGLDGEKGDTGDRGSDGINGTDGTNGVNGVDGAKGDKGETGAKGDTGEKGEAGADGTSNKITGAFLCQASLSFATASASDLTIPAGGLFFTYRAAILSSGDVWASASIANGSFQVFGSNFYSVSQNGAATASVVISDDWYNSTDFGWWNIEVDRVTSIPTATFHDVSLPNSSTRVFTFTATSCTVQQF